MPVIWCLTIAAAPPVCGLWHVKPSARRYLTLFGCCLLLVSCGEALAAYGHWPEYRARHIADAAVIPTCRGNDCSLSLTYANPGGQHWVERTDMLLADINCAGSRQTVVLEPPQYLFHECPGAIDGVIMPRLSGLGAQSIDQIPFGFTFRLPGNNRNGRDSRTYLFGLGTATHSLLTKGWSANESGYVWTDGKQADLDLPLVPFTPGTLVDVEFELSPFTVGVVKEQRLTVTVPNRSPQEFILYKNLEYITLSSVPAQPGNLHVTLRLPDATSPFSLGISQDARILGVAVHRIVISPQ